jgi:hypothetical protein
MWVQFYDFYDLIVLILSLLGRIEFYDSTVISYEFCDPTNSDPTQVHELSL